MNWHLILLIAGTTGLGLAGFGVNIGRAHPGWIGLALIAITFIA